MKKEQQKYFFSTTVKRGRLIKRKKPEEFGKEYCQLSCIHKPCTSFYPSIPENTSRYMLTEVSAGKEKVRKQASRKRKIFLLHFFTEMWRGKGTFS